MHIVHYGKYYPPYRGGVETVMESICRKLADKGFEVTALVANDSPQTVEEEMDGVRVIRMGRKYLVKSQPVCPGIGKKLQELNGDIIHVHLPNPLATLACLLAKPRGKMLALYHSDVVRQKLLGIPANWILKRFLKKTAAITVPTPQHIECSDILPTFRDRCRIIHFGIDPEPYANAGELPPALLPERMRQMPLALFVGRLVYYKGLNVFIRALQRTPGVAAAIIGEGPLREEAESFCRRAGLDRRITFLGHVEQDIICSLYKHADVFVLPSTCRSEMFGMVQLEAMAAGTPVISTDLPSGVPYVNADGETGLVVKPNDVQELSEAIRKLTSDRELARRMGRAGQARVATHFHEDAVAEEYAKLYREIAEERQTE